MNKVNLLIVEDDNNTVEEYKSDIKGFENCYIVGTTNNSSKAVEMVKEYRPHAVIPRLNKHQGSGNGLLFLVWVTELALPNKPFYTGSY